MILFLANYQNLGLLLLRLALGVIFIAHGFGKLKNIKGTGEWFGSIGFKPGIFWGTVVGLAEFFGGWSVLVGWYSQWGALFIAAVMIVALLWKLKNKQKLIGGYELDLALLTSALLTSTIPGGGMYSITYYLLS